MSTHVTPEVTSCPPPSAYSDSDSDSEDPPVVPQPGDISKPDLDSFAPDPVKLASTKKPRRKPQRPFPEDLAPLPRQLEKCQQLRLDCAREFERFRAFHEAKGNVFADWNRAFDTWILNAAPWRGPVRPMPQHRQPDSGYSPFAHAKQVK